MVEKMAAMMQLMIAVVLLLEAVVFPTTFRLERASHEVELSQLVARDRMRHGRLLQSASGVVDFSVAGTYNPTFGGPYYTKVQLGTPPKEFIVLIDTRSDVFWVSCNACSGCPGSSGLQIPLNFYDPSGSSTGALIACLGQRCSMGADYGCTHGQCSYDLQDVYGSGTSGYYVEDFMQLDTILEGSLTTNSSAHIYFGCSTLQSGAFRQSDTAFDGIFGLGKHSISVISQLSSQGITPRVFSHCLKGNGGDGGILVLGEIVEPNIVYSPLVPSQPHYSLNLQSISVNGQTLPINSSVFATSGTIIDCGSNFSFLAKGAYHPLISAILGFVSARPVSQESPCFTHSPGVVDMFPQVSFNFAGGASLILNPQDYLTKDETVGGAIGLCIGFYEADQGVGGQTILGGISLQDKIFVYDLDAQRIGWTNYDCSRSVNVSTRSTPGRVETVIAGQPSHNSASRYRPPKLISKSLIAFLLYIFLLTILWSILV